MEVLHGVCQQIGKVLPLQRLAGGFLLVAVHAPVIGHFSQDHLRVIQEILVDRHPVLRPPQVQPLQAGVCFGQTHVHQPFPLLEKEDVRGHLGPGVGEKSVVGQADGSNELRPLCDVFAHAGVLLVQGTLGGDKGHNAAGPHLVQGFGEKVVVNEKMIFIIPLVVERIAAERHIADGKVKKAVRQLGILKPLHRDAALLVQLLGDAAGEGVQLHAVQAAVLHALRHQPKKVANAAGRLQDVAGAETHILHRLIDGLDNGGGRVVGV